MAAKLKLLEILCLASIVSIVYISVLYVISHFVYTAQSSNDFWGFLPSVWDHPEFNYVFFDWICEFFSVMTAIPIAGYLLIYNAYKYSYSNIGHRKVLGLYCIICTMYSLAFVAHSTLSPLLMSCTLTAVLTNGVYTFYQYSQVTNWHFLQPAVVRALICVIAQSLIIYSVIKLPYMLGEYGGVPTLTIVQTPAVLFATFLVYLQLNKERQCKQVNRNHDQKEMTRRKIIVYELLLFAGLLLCSAMAVSFVEIAMDRQNANVFGCFPYLHVTIHLLEQVGIYNYGIGVAALQYLVLANERRTKLQYIANCVPYIYRDESDSTKKTK